MANVFVSYAHEDRAKAELIATAIERRGRSIFWDSHLIPGDQYRRVLDRELDSANCVVVLWSHQSVNSRWVLDEAKRGADRGVLVPALIDQVEIPLGFGEAQTANLAEWGGDPDGAEIAPLLAGIERALTGTVTVEREDPRSWLRRHLTFRTVRARISALLGAVALLVGLGLGMIEIYERFIAEPPPPPPMTGDFNVAVANFEVLEATDTGAAEREGKSLAGAVYAELDASLGCDAITFDCRPPGEVEEIHGDPTLRSARAEHAANEILANIVVHGTITEKNGRVTFAPEIYIANRDLLRAEELAGPHELAAQTGDVSRLDQRRELRARVEAQARNLSDLVLALSYYAGGRFDEALATIRQTIDAGTWEFDEELLHLIAGNLEGKLNRPEKAEASYRRALEIREGYGRGMLGLGEVAYQRGTGQDGKCTSDGVDEASLRSAIDLFQDATEASVAPPAANIDEKATFGIARSLVCLSQAGIEDRWSLAADLLAQVIAAYDDGTEGLVELAAEGHALRGFIVLNTVDPDTPDAAAYPGAIDEYEAAIGLSDFEARDAEWLFYIAFALERLEQESKACERLREAEGGNPEELTRNEIESALKRLCRA